MSECASGCDSCSHKEGCKLHKEPLNEYSTINKVFGIISGKGGVGKSTVTALLARRLAKAGYRVGIMDADITGPSIPKMFCVNSVQPSSGWYIMPAVSKEGIKIISMNLLLDNEETPVLYRGPIIASFIKQFWSNVCWGELDYLLIDMPPGTGDVALTVYQSLPLDGVIMVTSPQNLVEMIVMKAVNMTSKMSVPLIGIIENYSYFLCDNCSKKHYIFGQSRVEEMAERIGTKVLGKLPFISAVASLADEGEDFSDIIDINLEAITGDL